MERPGDIFAKSPNFLRQLQNGNNGGKALEQSSLQPSQQADGNVCPICHGAGYLRQDLPVGDPNFGKIIPCHCKEKELKRKRRLELGRLAKLDSHQDQTFDTFIHTDHRLQEAYRVARAYAENPQGWLLLSGPVGCGKTHLAAAIAHVCLERDSLVIFSTVPELLDHLRTAFAPSNEMPYHELFDRIREAYLLVLDDLGVEYSTPWATDKLFQIVNYRYEYCMPTIFTTNVELSGLDLRIRSRLSDKGLVKHCSIKAPDHRPQNAAKEAPRLQP
jgi:DNA replication protein DnaC